MKLYNSNNVVDININGSVTRLTSPSQTITIIAPYAQTNILCSMKVQGNDHEYIELRIKSILINNTTIANPKVLQLSAN